MKKYVKPELYYEDFTLSQHVAACGVDVNQQDQFLCDAILDKAFWYDDGGLQLFGETKTCKLDVKDFDVYCYTSGADEAGRLFNS